MMHRRTFARIAPMRAKLLFYVFSAVSLFLMWRLYDVQIVRGPQLAEAALEQRSDLIEVFARRGDIQDRYGAVLVHSLPSESVYAIPRDIMDPDRTALALRALVGKLSPGTVASLHDRSAWFVWIARKVPHEVAERVRSANLDGIRIKEEETGRRFDAVGTMAATVLGFVGTDENGLSGIESAFDDLLRGRSGQVTLEADQFGRPIPFGKETVLAPAQAGLTLQLTLDSYLQFVTERALDAQMRAFGARSGTAIVMDPWTGEVLALANAPSFDPNQFDRYTDDQQRDRAVMDAYEPGSTYKLVTAAAALDSGRVTTANWFPARDRLEVGGHLIHNAEDGFMANQGSSENLEQIVTYSHNVGAAEVGMATGARAFYAMERKAGFGDATQIGLPGENPGIVPPPAQWSDSSLATMAFGQGVSVTPIAMARFYSAIANGGVLMRPEIIKAITDQQGRTLYEYQPQIERRIFSQQTAATLRRFLRSAVLRGTGNPTAQVAGYTTAGKTGTAQLVVDGQYRPGAYAASFIGMVPYERPRFVIYVKLEYPSGSYYGAVVAAPAFAKIAREAMLHAGALPMPSASPAQHP